MDNTAKTSRKQNSSGKHFRFNFIDAILLIIIIAAIALMFYIFSSDNSFGTVDTVTLEYRVLITGIRDEFKDHVQIGDKVIDSVGLFEIGEVYDVKYSSYMFPLEDNSGGNVVLTEYPEHCDMEIYIRAEASLEAGMYYINGYKIAVGTLVSLRTPNFTEQGYCTVLAEAEADDEE